MDDIRNVNTPRNRGEEHAPHVSPVTPGEDARSIMINEISWGAVFAGASLALTIQIILNMLGIGIGAATLNPMTGDNPSASTFSLTAALWFAVSGIIAAFLGGHAAGRLSGRPKESTAAWHGLTAWAVSTLVLFYLLTTTVSGLIGGTMQALGSVASVAAPTAQSIAQSQQGAFSGVEEAMKGPEGQNAADASIAAVKAALTGDQQDTQVAREKAAQAIAQSQNVPIDEARRRVDQYEQQYRQALDQGKQKAAEVAETAASATSTAALFGAISLLVGAFAGWFGGRMGAVEPTLTRGRRHRFEDVS